MIHIDPVYFVVQIIYLILKKKNNMQQVYFEITQIVTKNYEEEDQLIIACPSAEQISLWMTINSV